MATGGYGRLIQKARDDRGLSQSRLAEKVFVNTRTVSRWETEKTRPSTESIKLIAMVLEIPLEDLEAAVAESTRASKAPDQQIPEKFGSSDGEMEAGKAPAYNPSAVKTGRPKPRWRWLPALAFAGLVLAAVFVVVQLQPQLRGGQKGREEAGVATPSSTQFAAFPSPALPAIPAGANPKAVLGIDIEPEEAAPCGTQNLTPGAEWIFGPASVGGVEHVAAYRCSMPAGGSGELVFLLDEQYSRVHLVVGFLSGSEGRGHTMRFAVLRDGEFTPMTPFELDYGDTSALDYSVEGVSRISIRLTETGASGTDRAPSTPVVASLRLF